MTVERRPRWEKRDSFIKQGLRRGQRRYDRVGGSDGGGSSGSGGGDDGGGGGGGDGAGARSDEIVFSRVGSVRRLACHDWLSAASRGSEVACRRGKPPR